MIEHIHNSIRCTTIIALQHKPGCLNTTGPLHIFFSNPKYWEGEIGWPTGQLLLNSVVDLFNHINLLHKLARGSFGKQHCQQI